MTGETYLQQAAREGREKREGAVRQPDPVRPDVRQVRQLLESNVSHVTNAESNGPKFDKVVYQREYMRKRRAAAKG